MRFSYYPVLLSRVINTPGTCARVHNVSSSTLRPRPIAGCRAAATEAARASTSSRGAALLPHSGQAPPSQRVQRPYLGVPATAAAGRATVCRLREPLPGSSRRSRRSGRPAGGRVAAVGHAEGGPAGGAAGEVWGGTQRGRWRRRPDGTHGHLRRGAGLPLHVRQTPYGFHGRYAPQCLDSPKP